MVAIASVRLPSKVTRGFTHRVRLLASRNNAPQHIAIFPDVLNGVYLCFIMGNRRSGFLELPVMVYADDLKEV